MFKKLGLCVLLVACGTEDDPNLVLDDSGPSAPVFMDLDDDGASVVEVEPDRYLGKWFEIATVPSFQQVSCSGTTARYSLNEDGSVRVRNRCYVGGLDGQVNDIEGRATFVDDSYARLLVDFGMGFEAPYDIVVLDGAAGDDPYQFAAVSSFGLQYWILSREPVMDDDLYDEVVMRLEELGLDASQLVLTEQIAEASAE